MVVGWGQGGIGECVGVGWKGWNNKMRFTYPLEHINLHSVAYSAMIISGSLFSMFSWSELLAFRSLGHLHSDSTLARLSLWISLEWLPLSLFHITCLFGIDSRVVSALVDTKVESECQSQPQPFISRPVWRQPHSVQVSALTLSMALVFIPANYH